MFENVTVEDAKRHIMEVVAMGARIAAPSIQRVTNEEPREIRVCAYNQSLLDNRKFRVKDLIPNGEAVDTVSKYEIHFYNALYNLSPDKLKKFAALRPMVEAAGMKVSYQQGLTLGHDYPYVGKPGTLAAAGVYRAEEAEPFPECPQAAHPSAHQAGEPPR